MFGEASNAGFLNGDGSSDIFLAKYDPDGQLLWIEAANGPGTDNV